MRAVLAVATAAIVVGVLAAADRGEQMCALTISLVDADTGGPIAGVIRVAGSDGENVPLKGLLARGIRTRKKKLVVISDWSVLAKPATVDVPRQELTVEAFSGIETEISRVAVNLTGTDSKTLSIPVRRFYHAADRSFRSGNTHLHLQRIDREKSDRYLAEVPRADGVDIVFVSYLERAIEDRTYITNDYTADDLARLEEQTGVGFANGEEHRNNFIGRQGYGHVMLLNLKKLILPVSIGPGIMKTGTDGIPLQRGIDTARGDGATVIWCHNDLGLEDIPNLVTGRMDAQNIFDGPFRSSYKHTFYRYLNAGFHVPFSTGTDWFIYDFSRVYVESGKYVTPQEWLQGLAAGKTYITNGPLLEFHVDGNSLGSTVNLAQAGQVKVAGRAVGRVDFEKIEVIRNGEVIRTAEARPEGKHFTAAIEFDLDVATPCWLALRTPPQSIPGDEELTKPTPLNELENQLFAHTSAIYVNVAGRGVFDEHVARGMLEEMLESRAIIAEHKNFADGIERGRVLDVYNLAIKAMQRHIAERSPR